MSNGAETGEKFQSEWARLEKTVEEATRALGGRDRRSLEATDEIQRLRAVIDQLTVERAAMEARLAEIEGLKKQNSALQRRMLTARKKVSGLMQKLSALELDR